MPGNILPASACCEGDPCSNCVVTGTPKRFEVVLSNLIICPACMNAPLLYPPFSIDNIQFDEPINGTHILWQRWQNACHFQKDITLTLDMYRYPNCVGAMYNVAVDAYIRVFVAGTYYAIVILADRARWPPGPLSPGPPHEFFRQLIFFWNHSGMGGLEKTEDRCDEWGGPGANPYGLGDCGIQSGYGVPGGALVAGYNGSATIGPN